MNVKAITAVLFGEDTGGFILFDDVDEIEIGAAQPLDEDQLLLNMPDMQLDLQLDGVVYAVAFPAIDLTDATLVARKEDKTFGVWALDPPVPADDVPESMAMAIPVGVGWEYVDTDNEFVAFDALLPRVSGQEESDDAEDVVHEGEVLDADLAEEPGGTEASGDDEEPQARMNDAVLFGTDHPEMQELLARPFPFMTGRVYGQKDRRNTQDGDWQRVELPLLAWLEGEDKGRDTWGLTRHPVAKSKEGASIVLAESIGGARKDAAIETMHAIGLDIDSGAALQDVLDKLLEAGLFAIVYTSFSHGKDILELKHDDIVRKLKLDDTPNRAQIQAYLREHHKDRYDVDFIDSIEIVDARKQTPDGLRVVLKTRPLDKFRVILPLWEPVKLSDLAATVSQWKDVWADAVTGVAVNMLGVSFDSTSCDVNRLFYTPRHPEGADHFSAVVMGRPLRFDEIEPYSKMSYVKNRDPGDPFAMGADLEENARDTFITPGGLNLNRWHAKHKDRFLIADVIETFAPDKVRVAGGEKVGTVHLECPFEHEHSTEGGTATMAMNPDANTEHGYWTIFCRHDSCQGRDKLEFLNQMIIDGWFDESVLRDEDWNLGEADEEAEEPAPEPEEKSAVDIAAEFDANSSEEEIRKFLKKQVKLKADMTTRGAITEVLAKRTNLTKTEVRSIWKEYSAERDRKRREEAASNDQDTDSVPVVNQWDFGEMVTWSERRIQDANAARPRLFHYIDDIARIEETAERLPRIRMLSEKQFAAELNSITKWHHLSHMGDMERKREVSAPTDVVSQLYSSIHTVYPKLRGLVTTPTFTRDGELITEPGFHESGLFYWNDGSLDVPKVSRAPTDDEVYEAKRLLIEEVFADFPLGGLVRDEIIENALHGEGDSAVTNLISMVLLMFGRDLVDGPTPGHLLTKPSPGTGASLLTDVCSIIANGEVTPALALPTSKEEMAKTLITIMADGSNMIYFDNIDQSIDSGELASAMTAPKYKARMLGKSQSIEAEVRAVWVLCGNNVRLSQELIRRLVMVDLDARMANPEKRSGWRHADIRGWVGQNRGKLVWACLTLIQNWVAKGMKPEPSAILNSYENWSRVMGGILRDAGLGGFLANREELRERASDGGEDDITLFLDAWWERYIDKPVLMRSADQKEESLIQMAIEQDLQLPIRLKRSVDDEPTYDPKMFGKFLGTYEGRVMRISDGTEVRVTRGKRTKAGYYWQLEVTKAATDDVED